MTWFRWFMMMIIMCTRMFTTKIVVALIILSTTAARYSTCRDGTYRRGGSCFICQNCDSVLRVTSYKCRNSDDGVSGDAICGLCADGAYNRDHKGLSRDNLDELTCEPCTMDTVDHGCEAWKNKQPPASIITPDEPAVLCINGTGSSTLRVIEDRPYKVVTISLAILVLVGMVFFGIFVYTRFSRWKAIFKARVRKYTERWQTNMNDSIESSPHLNIHVPCGPTSATDNDLVTMSSGQGLPKEMNHPTNPAGQLARSPTPQPDDETLEKQVGSGSHSSEDASSLDHDGHMTRSATPRGNDETFLKLVDSSSDLSSIDLSWTGANCEPSSATPFVSHSHNPAGHTLPGPLSQCERSPLTPLLSQQRHNSADPIHYTNDESLRSSLLENITISEDHAATAARVIGS